MRQLNRKQNFVDSSIQGALLRRMSFHWMVFFGLTTFAVLFVKTFLGDPNQPILERFRFEVGEYMFIGIIILTLFPAFMLDAVRFSNRFVGPIARLRRHLRELGQNQESDSIKFRQNDFWLELGGEFNRVKDLVAAQKREIEELKSELGSAESSEMTQSSPISAS